MQFPSPSPKQARILWLSLTGFALGVLLALIGLLIWGAIVVLDRLSTILLPLAIAAIIAYLLDPVVDYFERKRVSRFWSILLVFFIATLIVLGMMATVVPRLVIETQTLVEQTPQYIRQLSDRIDDVMEQTSIELRLRSFWPFSRGATNEPPKIPPPPTNQIVYGPMPLVTNGPAGPPPAIATRSVWETEVGQRVLAWTAQAVPAVSQWVLRQATRVASWAGLVIGLALVPVYAFYFLLEKKGIERRWTDYLPIRDSWLKEEVVFIIRAINDYMILFFRGQILVALCIGALLTIGFLVMGLNYALLFGFVAGLLSIVPYLGVIISIIPTMAVAAVQFQDWWHPVLVAIIFGVVQFLEGFFISPKIMGDRVGLHPLTIILAVMIGTALLGGILGGVLAIPLTAALRVLMFRYVWKPIPGDTTLLPDPRPALRRRRVEQI